MKKVILLLLILIISMSAYSFWGFGRANNQGMMGYRQGGYSRFEESKEVTSYINNLKKKYSLTEEEELDADKLNNNELEELGALLMASHAVDDEQLKFMKSRMGGDGSKDLKDTYRYMSANYLNGYGMMGYGRSNSRANKRGFFGGRGSCFGRGGNRGFGGETSYSSDSALEILRKRYANGEITKKEYNEMKEILEK